MKMTNEQAIKQLNEIIACWEEFLADSDNNDLLGPGLELEALRMAKRALELEAMRMAVRALREKSLSEAYRED